MRKTKVGFPALVLPALVLPALVLPALVLPALASYASVLLDTELGGQFSNIIDAECIYVLEAIFSR
jgi:hypothetical protein